MRQRLLDLARAAIADCEGGRVVSRALTGPHWRYAWVWAVGKAAASMARDFGGALIIDGRIAGHPLPDARSVDACAHLLLAAESVSADERALLLISGGASAMVGAPIEGLTLDDLQAATRALLDGGAPIGDINVVRRHLTRLGGGELAAACPGAIDVLAISDVDGDDPATIGSGPASPEPRDREQAVNVARAYNVPDRVIQALLRVPENPRADHPAFARGTYRVLANPATLRDAAAARATQAGLSPIVDDRFVRGDVADFARALSSRAASLAPGEVFIAVGEPTLKVRGGGLGGRAQHVALTVACAARNASPAFTLVACGSDGRDGPTDAAGAVVDGTTAAALADQRIDGARALADCDSNGALSAIGAAIPRFDSGTNVTDLYLLARG
jgi:glycerate 2-kinase